MIDHREELTKAVRVAAKEAEKKYKNLNPEASRLGLRAEVTAYGKRPKDFAGYETRAVALFLNDRSTLTRNNEQIASMLSQGVPGYKAPPNLLTEALRPKARHKIAEVLEQRGINLTNDQLATLSKIKRALLAFYAGERESVAFFGRVTFTADEVIVSGRRHAIHKDGKHRRVHVGKAMLNVEGLKALLRPPPR